MKVALMLTVCVASTLFANAAPVPVAGRTVILPFPATECSATNLLDGQTPSVECKPSDAFSEGNVLAAGTRLDLPTGDFARCEFTADDEGETQMGCVGVPVSAPSGPIVEDGVLTLPTTAKSCELSNIHSCPNDVVLEPVIECTPAGPGEAAFRAGETFDFSSGNMGRCTIAADPEGRALPGCVGVPIAGFPPMSVDRSGVITFPEGAASCTAVHTSRRLPPVVTCVAPVSGCRQPVFAAGATARAVRGASNLQCVYTAVADGSSGAPRCSSTRGA